MKYLKIIFICSMLFNSCESVVNNKETPDETKIGANAGDDQTTYVGSYVVFDISKSIIKEPIDIIEWIQDLNNPQEVSLFAPSLKEKSVTGFEKEGIYKFTLSIQCKGGVVYTDSVVITVKPRQVSLIKDLFLEARIRLRLNYKEGDLNADKLQMLDTLPYPEFYIKNYKIKNISGVEYCTNIAYLPLPGESITDLKPLSNLTKLEVLDLNQNYTVEDITPIHNLINLKKLTLYSNPIKDISVLGNLTKLTELYLMYTPISDIGALKNLVNLEILYLDCSGMGVILNSIDPLAYLTKLRHLYLCAAGITNIKPLENLTELVLLNLSFNNLTDISPVSKLTKLIRLYVGFNKIENLNGIKNLENLDYLDAMNNQIKDISELQYLQKIHLIGLDGNKIEDITPIVNNHYLNQGVFLYLKNNPLNDKTLNEYIPALIARGITVYW